METECCLRAILAPHTEGISPRIDCWLHAICLAERKLQRKKGHINIMRNNETLLKESLALRLKIADWVEKWAKTPHNRQMLRECSRMC